MALVVEDGTGLSTAEAYISEVDADTYFNARTVPAAWSSASSAEKEAALRMAAEYMDSTYGLRWKGTRTEVDQALDWPRYDVEDRDGNVLDATVLPTALVRANAELASRQLSAELMPDVDAGESGITSESVKAGPVSQTVQFAGTKSTAKRFPKVDRMLSDLVRPGGEIRRA